MNATTYDKLIKKSERRATRTNVAAKQETKKPKIKVGQIFGKKQSNKHSSVELHLHLVVIASPIQNTPRERGI